MPQLFRTNIRAADGKVERFSKPQRIFPRNYDYWFRTQSLGVFNDRLLDVRYRKSYVESSPVVLMTSSVYPSICRPDDEQLAEVINVQF